MGEIKMEEKSKINNLKINKVIENTSLQKEPILEGELTGYPSIDKPWLKYYPSSLFVSRQKFNRVLDKIKSVWTSSEEIIINYYDTEIKVGDFFNRIEEVAKSFVALGIKKGDSVVASLESVPEYIELLFACELIGCSIKNYIGDIDGVINLINEDNSINYYIAPNYLSIYDSSQVYDRTNIKSIITVDPLFSVADKSKLRNNIAEVINSKYTTIETNDPRNISWEEFLNEGKVVEHFEENNNNTIKLFSAFTSGSTGIPKEVIHSSESILGIVNQLTLFPFYKECKDTWLHTITPPSHVAVVISMICYPLADGKELILDPYCKIEDTDIEIMHYEPTCWGLAPVYFNALLDSKRIPEEYDMSYFKLIGFGAEPLTKKYLEKVQKFLDSHNCKVPFSTSYGQSEGGSGFTTTFGREMVLSGSYGIPYIDTTISIFEPNTTKELKYYEVGEICKNGPGIMLGYSDNELTDKVLKEHSDGKIWLHTGDFGYMTEEGLLFVLGREGIRVYYDKVVFPLEIENKVASLEGVKDAIVVSGKNNKNKEFSAPYLFIVPEKGISISELLIKTNNFINAEFPLIQRPEEVFIIDEKPIKKSKVDKKLLQKKYNLI